MLSLVLALTLVSILVLLLVAKPRGVFLLILSGLVLFYTPILQSVILLTIGDAKVYPGDLITASISGFLIFQILQRRFPLNPRSARLFSLFFIWGIIAIVKGIPRYGYSAVGEARWYILPMLYYFFVSTTFKNQQQIQWLLRWLVYLILLMVPVKFVYFYFLGGKEQLPPLLFEDPRTSFRFINATEGLLVAFVLIGLLLFYMLGGIKGHHVSLYSIFGVLLLSLITTQTRSVWLASVSGLALLGVQVALRLARGKVPRQTFILFNTALVLLIISPFIASQLNTEIYEVITTSALFFRNPLGDPTGSWRLIGWQQELEKAMQSPLWGHGMGGYSEWFDGVQWQRVAVHNGYLMHFTKFGIVGLLLLFAGIFFWYLEMAKYIRIEKQRNYKLLGHAIQIFILMHLVFALFYDFTIFFWILLASGTVLTKRGSSKAGPQEIVTLEAR